MGRSGESAAFVEATIATARAAWPQIYVPDDVFLAYVARRVPADSQDPSALRTLPVAELYLACACVNGDPRAIAAFEERYFGEIEVALARMSVPGTVVDEVKQSLRRDLFVADGECGPRISNYAGQGSLAGWLRIAAARAAMKLFRKQKRETPVEDDLLADLAAPSSDLELEYIKQRYRAEFKEAVKEAIAGLPSREQNVLRQHALDGLTIDQIGKLYGVHRATAARWIARVRRQIMTRTRQALMRQMRIERSDCDSLIRLLHTQLSVTLGDLPVGNTPKT